MSATAPRDRSGRPARDTAPARSIETALSADSTVTQDYLKAVWAATEWGGAGASITGLAQRMGVAASTASENVSRLVDAGLLEHEPYRAVTLSAEGRRRAMGMVRRHRLLETYLVEALGFDWDEVHEEAEVLEHAVSERLLDRVDAALGRPSRDPHGDPIPTADGAMAVPALRSLDALRVGETGAVARIQDDPATLQALDRAGIGLDSRIVVVGRDRADDASGLRPTLIRLASGPGGQASSEGCAGGAAEAGEAVIPAGALWVLAED
ncbi:metal-dependent transcriptional regulator [Actinomyces timonensis]|uniref:metal-dependent transcriptional regulator n=1 Tax=Actinomyces timonensis TaxID=1288391 RepID=UPI0002E90604|nr:metal-dependent transcriptional regulator [Actinomyces timonensis]